MLTKPPHQILVMGKEWERDLQKEKALGKESGQVPFSLTLLRASSKNQ